MDTLYNWIHSSFDSFASIFSEKGIKLLPATPLPHPLDTVPTEIWQNVISFLDPASSASLAFTCHMFLYISGTQTLKRLNDVHLRSQKIKFLRHLDPSFPNRILCHRCATFHQTAPRREDERGLHWQLIKIQDNEYNFHETFGSVQLRKDIRKLPWAAVQSAARAMRHGPRFGRLLPDSSSEAGKDGWKYSMQSRLVDDHFLFRYESFKVINFSENVTSDEIRKQLLCPIPPVCSHFRDHIQYMIGCARRHVITDPSTASRLCSYCSVLRRCFACASEYLVNVESGPSQNDSTCILRISRWADLGDGWDPRHRLYDAAWKNESDWPGVFDLGELPTVRSRFETAIGNSIPDQVIAPLRQPFIRGNRMIVPYPR